MFLKKDDEISLELIGEGLTAILTNAKRLLSDAQHLSEAKRYASARFLLTTATEEMAKSLILLDMCRLNFKQHESVLKKLCQAFYDHIYKYAYFQIYRLDSIIYDLNHVKEIWDSEVTKWWPNMDIESGEPDMPHATVFSREMPLYVDYIEFDKQWWIPSDKEESLYFTDPCLKNRIKDATNLLLKIELTNNIGYFNIESLNIFHTIFKNKYFKECSTTKELSKIYDKLFKQLSENNPQSFKDFKESIYYGWPLYHFMAL